LPTFGQFNYWLDHDDDRPPEVARRPASASPAPLPQVQLPPLDACRLPAGRPGAGFYLDAVRADVQLVSRADRKQAIGHAGGVCGHRFFSRLVCGVYIGFGEAQWPQAMLALANCGADKQRYASSMAAASRRSSGRAAICRKRCSSTPADAGWNGDHAAQQFQLRCVAVDDGPDDWRAVLEKRFRLLAPTHEGAPCRLDGVMDLEQFTRIVVDCILYYNSRQPLAHAGKATPRQLWEWGVNIAAGGLKIYPEHLIRCSLMPVAQAR
jgi:hypothetical protein